MCRGVSAIGGEGGRSARDRGLPDLREHDPAARALGCHLRVCRQCQGVTEVRKLLTIEHMPNHLAVSAVIISKLTSKAQTTIPQPIRAVLGLQPGDEMSYEIVGGRVMLAKVQRGTTTDDPFRSFEEWRSDADAKAYADL